MMGPRQVDQAALFYDVNRRGVPTPIDTLSY
jgi:hypothetical protein